MPKAESALLSKKKFLMVDHSNTLKVGGQELSKNEEALKVQTEYSKDDAPPKAVDS